MKKLSLLCLVPLILSGCGSASGSSENSSIEESSPIDYGTVVFDGIYVYPDGFDGVKIRPYFSNNELEGKIEFSYQVEDESICEIDSDNKVWYKSTGTTKVTVTSQYYDETYFYVYCEDSMMPSNVFSTAKDMARSVYNSYEDGDTLFVGDSFFQFWRDGTNGVNKFSDVFGEYKVFNIGISAATSHDLRALNENIVNFTTPKNIIINIGINNVDDDGELGLVCYRNIKALVDDYLEMFENANIYYLSITRCTNVFANKWTEHNFSNLLMKSYCETKERLHYLDVMELYGNNPSIYQSDGLHPNQAGYDLFESIIKENVSLELK